MSEKTLEVIFLPSSFKCDLVMLFLLLLFFALNFSFILCPTTFQNSPSLRKNTFSGGLCMLFMTSKLGLITLFSKCMFFVVIFSLSVLCWLKTKIQFMIGLFCNFMRVCSCDVGAKSKLRKPSCATICHWTCRVAGELSLFPILLYVG